MRPAHLLILVALFVATADFHSASAQNQNPSPTAKKPVRKPDQVPSDDPVVLLTPRSTSDKSIPVSQSSDMASTPADETNKKAAEIARLESQIKEKTQRITFLMRLFVTDQRTFLTDPANQNVPEAAQDERKYEQDELRWETAELARLKHRLNEIKAVK